MIKMTFNDVDFSRWLVITKGFTTFGGADFDVTTKDVGFNGTHFVKNRYKEKIITVPFYIEYPQLTDYDAFQRALYVTEPQKLTFRISQTVTITLFQLVIWILMNLGSMVKEH